MNIANVMLSLALVAPLSASAEPGSERAFTAALQAVQFSAAAGGRQLAAGFGASRQEEDTLLQLMRDRDPEVRRQAVRAFKAYVGRRSSHRAEVLRMVNNASEVESVRYEAIKTLSAVSGYSDVHDRLLNLAERGPSDRLRAISYKSLYWRAQQAASMRDELVSAARREPNKEVRKAAIWGLFLATANNSARDPLLQIARRDADPELRVEALKSLYGVMGYHEVRELAFSLARARRTEPSVRSAAILMLSARVNSDARELLQDIAQRDPDAQARRSAIIALGDPNSEELARFFHTLRRNQQGVVIGDPLDWE